MSDTRKVRLSSALQGYLQVTLVAGALFVGFFVNAALVRGNDTPMIRAVSSTQPIVDTVMPDIRDVPLRIRESGTVVARNSLQLSPQVGG
ncbi:MAG: hypothetical protein AAF270_15280, partial [Pseudomonadota bacterium]